MKYNGLIRNDQIALREFVQQDEALLIVLRVLSIVLVFLRPIYFIVDVKRDILRILKRQK